MSVVTYIKNWKAKAKISDVPEPEKGYLINCYISGKSKDTVLFGDGNGLCIAFLDGYAIIPMEEYEELKRNQDQ